MGLYFEYKPISTENALVLYYYYYEISMRKFCRTVPYHAQTNSVHIYT